MGGDLQDGSLLRVLFRHNNIVDHMGHTVALMHISNASHMQRMKQIRASVQFRIEN
jgi:hypothetical protein